MMPPQRPPSPVFPARDFSTSPGPGYGCEPSAHVDDASHMFSAATPQTSIGCCCDVVIDASAATPVPYRLPICSCVRFHGPSSSGWFEHIEASSVHVAPLDAGAVVVLPPVLLGGGGAMLGADFWLPPHAAAAKMKMI